MGKQQEIQDIAFAGDERLLKKILNTDNSACNARDTCGHSALHKASMNGWLACVSLLLDADANVNAVDLSGCTALHHAASNGYLNVCQLLIERGRASFTIKSNKGYTPAHMARSRGQLQVVAYLEECSRGKTSSQWARS